MGTADELTGLPGAREFARALAGQAALARRYDRPGAIIVVAAQRADDPGCRAVARALRGRLRATDLVARLAGAEFAVLIPEAREADARELAGELVALVARASGAAAAAGIACFPDGLDRPSGALLADADAALAAARGAEPAVALFDARVSRSRRGAASRAGRLRRALAADGLTLDLQPVVDLRTGAADHMSAVVRLAGADDAAEPLLAAAERFGLAGALDRFGLERTLAGAGGTATVVLPLGASAAGDRAFAGWLVDALSAFPDAAARLLLAVPEEAAHAELAAVRSLAARAGEFGVRLALDGFGQLGAFALLKALPVHQVRLAPALVRGLPGSDRDRAVVMALVHAAEALDVVTVATGVDAAAELTAVRGFGIGFGQGGCLNRPPQNSTSV